MMPAIWMMKNFIPRFNNEGASLKSMLLKDGAITLYRPVNRVILNKLETTKGEAQRAIQSFKRSPRVVNVRIHIIVNESICCIKSRPDAPAGF